MTIKKHNHKLRRAKLANGEKMFFCILDCSYRVLTSLALGKQVICNRCGKVFEMNEISVRAAKPHCNKCTVKKDHSSMPSLDDLNITVDRRRENRDVKPSTSEEDLLSSLRNRLDHALDGTGTEDEDLL